MKLKEGIKYDEKKERTDLMPADALLEVAKVFTFGASKYEDRNYEKGMKWGRVFGAILRHLFKFWSGEDHDKETGYHHMTHATCCCLMMLTYVLNPIYLKFDDRSKIFLKNYFKENTRETLKEKIEHLEGK